MTLGIVRPVREPVVRWKVGVEIELVAPVGSSRLALARRLGRAFGGSVKPKFFRDAEPTPLEGKGYFFNLTRGYEVRRAGRSLVQFLDDITLQQDLDRQKPPAPGWYRVLSDDARLIGLAQRRCDPRAPLSRVLSPLVALFGARTERLAGRMVKLSDATGAPLFLACPLPGERERACEIVTAPMSHRHAATLGMVLGVARELGFQAPVEGATHLHFDGRRFLSARVLRNLVLLVHPRRELFRALLGTNPACLRLGPWPDKLVELVAPRRFSRLPWSEARAHLASAGASKYCDLNLVNLVRQTPEKLTLEWRILPVHLEVGPILDAAVLFERMLRWALSSRASNVSLGPALAPTHSNAQALFDWVRLPAQVAARLLSGMKEPALREERGPVKQSRSSA